MSSPTAGRSHHRHVPEHRYRTCLQRENGLLRETARRRDALIVRALIILGRLLAPIVAMPGTAGNAGLYFARSARLDSFFWFGNRQSPAAEPSVRLHEPLARLFAPGYAAIQLCDPTQFTLHSYESLLSQVNSTLIAILHLIGTRRDEIAPYLKHQLERRIQVHCLLCVLAYHLRIAIETTLIRSHLPLS